MAADKVIYRVCDQNRIFKEVFASDLASLKINAMQAFGINPKRAIGARVTHEKTGSRIVGSNLSRLFAPQTKFMLLWGKQKWVRRPSRISFARLSVVGDVSECGSEPEPELPVPAVDKQLYRIDEEESSEKLRQIVAELRDLCRGTLHDNPEAKAAILENICQILHPYSAETSGLCCCFLNTIKEDPEFFHGIKGFFEKDKYFENREESRLGNYYYKARGTVIDHVGNDVYHKKFETVFAEFKSRLNASKKGTGTLNFYRQFFSREKLDCLFLICQGTYDNNFCTAVRGKSHRLAIYHCGDNRVTLSKAWELDHVIPQAYLSAELVEAVMNMPEDKALNWLYFFELYFTTANIKVVHQNCHDVTEHSSKIIDNRCIWLPKDSSHVPVDI